MPQHSSVVVEDRDTRRSGGPKLALAFGLGWVDVDLSGGDVQPTG